MAKLAASSAIALLPGIVGDTKVEKKNEPKDLQSAVKAIAEGPMNPPPPSGATQALVVSGGEPAMYQYFPTVPGQMYEVSFEMRLPDLSGGVPVEGASIVGPAEFEINLNDLSKYLVQNRTTWDPYKFDFVATSTSTELWQEVPQYINGFGLFQLSEDVFIDGEAAYLVPEPSICALALVGAALLFLHRPIQPHFSFLNLFE